MNAVQVDEQIDRCFSTDTAEGEADPRWAIVLSGGEGVESWRQSRNAFRARRPKQYCRLKDDRTPLQQTLDRAASIVPSEQVVTVIGRAHQTFLAEPNAKPIPGTIIEQPLNLGTAPGILLPLAFVCEIDPEANLIILPSDHFVHPERLFLQHAAQAFRFVEQFPDRLILVGVPADRPETSYGWIVPQVAQNVPSAGPDVPPLLHVKSFREKPGLDEAVSLLTEDALWSTMVIVAKAKLLWEMARKCLPDAMAAFDAFRQVLRTARQGDTERSVERYALTDLYEKLKPADFSTDILQRVRAQVSVMPLLGVTWCDLGRARHLTETLAQLDLGASA